MRDFSAEIAKGRCAENHGCGVASICICDFADDAVQEIERLRAALKPFVFGDPKIEEILWGGIPDDKPGTITIKCGDLRRAREALK